MTEPIDTIEALETVNGVAFGQIEDGLFRVHSCGSEVFDAPYPRLGAVIHGEFVERMLVDALLRERKDRDRLRKLLDLLSSEDDDD